MGVKNISTLYAGVTLTYLSYKFRLKNKLLSPEILKKQKACVMHSHNSNKIFH